jgi:rfaE bifunctional protein nucleotidyltransferase chain/domain
MDKIIWTNGCFDVLHIGHVELFKYAKSLGDYLVGGIDSDARVKAAKGDSRPFNTMSDRIAVLESIRYIDKVVWFEDEQGLDTQVLTSGAKIMVVGSDYKDKKVIGSRHVNEVKFFDRIGNHSTSRILDKIK